MMKTLLFPQLEVSSLAMLSSVMREAREGEVNINTLSFMIHYNYTGELADGGQDLAISREILI